RNVLSGKVKFCLYDPHSNLCLKEVADIIDICDHVDQGCPLKKGGIYKYNSSFFAPDVLIMGEGIYKLYDEECNVLACVEYYGEIRSKNKVIPQKLFTDDSYPCGGK
ncbi:unnamed protein product, partial [Dicrocoelium dendriticum]